MNWVLIGLGGAAGTLARYAAGLAAARLVGAAFPYGTLLVNVLGCFLLGVVAEAMSGVSIGGTEARLVLGVGVLGGFTTYSSFNLELLRLFEQGELGRAGLYLAVTLVGGVAAGLGGLALGRAL